MLQCRNHSGLGYRDLFTLRSAMLQFWKKHGVQGYADFFMVHSVLLQFWKRHWMQGYTDAVEILAGSARSSKGYPSMVPVNEADTLHIAKVQAQV